MSTPPALVTPAVVSQKTCFAVYGVSPRWYLDRARAGLFDSKKVGKLVLSRPEDFLAYLATLPGARTSRAAKEPAPPPVPANANAKDIAARYGLGPSRRAG